MTSHRLHGRAWLVLLVALVLVASHVALFRLFSRAPLSLALVVSTVTAVVLKYVWWKRRR